MNDLSKKNKEKRKPGHLGVFELKINFTGFRIAIFLTIFGLTAYTINKYHLVETTTLTAAEQNQRNEETIKFYVTTIGLGISTASAIYLADNVRAVANARREEEDLRKIDRALSLIERWNSPSYNELRLKIETKVKDIEKKLKEDNGGKNYDRFKIPPMIKDHINSDPTFKTSVSDMLNFLEEISLSVRNDLVKEHIIKDYFLFIFDNYNSLFSIWIKSRQEEATKVNGTQVDVAKIIYKDFNWLNKRWHN